ncbi:MAG: GDP-L-fucose synthase [Deltaproteobacteria bacterium]|nr:GDP-L-fucose synthase [Deltaproteobacteria bacterium]
MELRGKRIMVTGGEGFLGSRLVAQLRAADAEVFVARSSEYDLVQQQNVHELYRDSRPELVFHLAARVGGIGANQRNPGRFFYDNLQMGVHIIEEGRLAGISKVVVVATICAYPKFTPVPFAEKDLWNGYPEETNAPYGIAKKALLVMAQAYRQQYGLNTLVLFPVNLYGPGDNFDLEDSHVIPAMIRKCVESKLAREDSIVLWGDGSPTREFLYVDDCARALVLAAQHYDSSEAVNVGAGFEIKMRDLAELICELTEFEGKIIWDTARPNGQPRRMLDTTRARERFGFTATTSFKDGLKKTIAWYEENRGKSK